MLTDLITLDRPLVWMDVETHDKVPPEKSFICEIGFVVFYPVHYNKEPLRWGSLIKPPVPISASATEVHHITNEMVADAPPWSHVAANIARGFEGVDFGGYNIRFDVRVTSSEMARVGVKFDPSSARLIDPLRLWQVSKPRTLTDALKEFCDREPRDAHRALTDAEDAHDVAHGMLKRFDKLPRTVQGLHDLAFPPDPNALDPDRKIVWAGDEAVINFGKHSGTKLRNMPSGYMKWMVSDGDFTPTVKRIISEALAGNFPRKD